jgi:large subunit ribosomal protein L13
LGDDKVVVNNVSGLVMTGTKTDKKIYYKHTGPLGHLKERKFADVFKKNPGWILRHAVRLMLPKNRLNAKRLKNLTIN